MTSDEDVKHPLYAHLAGGRGKYDMTVRLLDHRWLERSFEAPVLLSLEGAEFDVRDDFVKPYGAWRIYLKDGTTDDEHDTAYFADITLAVPRVVRTWGDMEIIGLATEISYWPSIEAALAEAETCDSDYYHPEGAEWKKGHQIVSWFTPPERKELRELDRSFVSVTLRG